MIKKYMKIIPLLFIVVVFSVTAYSQDVKLVDDAYLFDDKEKTEILDAMYKYEKELSYTAEMFVHTTNNEYLIDTEKYIADYYKKYIEPVSKNAIIYLIDMGNRNVFIYVSDSIKSNFTDEILDSIIDSSFYFMSDERYADFIIGEIKNTPNPPVFDEKESEKKNYLLITSIAVVAGAVAGTVGVISVKSSYKMYDKDAPYKLKENSYFNASVRNDRFIRKSVVTQKINKNDNNSNSNSGKSSSGSGRIGSVSSSNGRGRSF